LIGAAAAAAEANFFDEGGDGGWFYVGWTIAALGVAGVGFAAGWWWAKRRDEVVEFKFVDFRKTSSKVTLDMLRALEDLDVPPLAVRVSWS
jgi:hypothetical protein